MKGRRLLDIARRLEGESLLANTTRMKSHNSYLHHLFLMRSSPLPESLQGSFVWIVAFPASKCLNVWIVMPEMRFRSGSWARPTTIANVVFGSDPPIDANVLAKAFQLDKKIVEELQAKFWSQVDGDRDALR